MADQGFVFQDEDAPGVHGEGRGGFDGGGGIGFNRRGAGGEVDAHDGALARDGLDEEGAAVGFGDGFANREAKAGGVGIAAGGEIGLEDVGEDGGVDAFAGVANGDGKKGFRGAGGRQGETQGDGAGAGMGLLGVADEIAEETADLVAVDLGGAEGVGGFELIVKTGTPQPFGEPVADEAAEFGGLADGDSAAREGQELLHQVLRLEAGAAGGGEFLTRGGIGFHLHFGEGDVAEEDR